MVQKAQGRNNKKRCYMGHLLASALSIFLVLLPKGYCRLQLFLRQLRTQCQPVEKIPENGS
jgi:hypothetical protein